MASKSTKQQAKTTKGAEAVPAVAVKAAAATPATAVPAVKAAAKATKAAAPKKEVAPVVAAEPRVAKPVDATLVRLLLEAVITARDTGLSADDLMKAFNKTFRDYLGEEKLKKKKSKDKNAPKRGKTAFIFFVNEIRDKVKAEKPALTFSEMGKELSARWAQLNENARKKYHDLAVQDKSRYETEKAAYAASKAATA
jgi:hypothetical protein